MKLFCKEDHTKVVPLGEETFWVFKFRGAVNAFLGEKSTIASIKDALKFTERPYEEMYWDILREHHPKSSLYFFMNPYKLMEVKATYTEI